MGRRVDPDALEKRKKKLAARIRQTDASHSDCLMQHEVGTDRFLHYKIRFWSHTTQTANRQPRTLNQKIVRLTTNVNRM